MVIFKRKFICNLFLITHILLKRFAIFVEPYMVLNKHLMLGLQNSVLQLDILISLLAPMTQHSLSVELIEALFFFYFTLMTWSLLEMILPIFLISKNILISNLKWNIWAPSIIFLILRSLLSLMDIIYLRPSMLQNYFLELA